MRVDKKCCYIPYIFRSSNSVRGRRILLEYLNFIYYQEYKSLYEISYNKRYKYFIKANVDICRDRQVRQQYFPGLTAYISVPKQYKEKRSIIEIKGKTFELHGPGSLVLAGCPDHTFCKFPSFESSTGAADTSNSFTYSIFNSIEAGQLIRCFYGYEYEINNKYVCENKSCDFNA